MLIHIHGGGLVYYNTRVFRNFLSKIAADTQVEIVALDYPKSPETESKIILSELHNAIRTILNRNQGCRFILAGDSVGGYLALHLSLNFPMNTLKVLHLIYPVVGRKVDEKNPYASGYFLDASLMKWFYEFINPLFTEIGGAPVELSENILRKFPMVNLHVAQYDILTSDVCVFSEKLKKVDRLYSITEHINLPHDFCLYSDLSLDADNAVKKIATMIHKLM